MGVPFDSCFYPTLQSRVCARLERVSEGQKCWQAQYFQALNCRKASKVLAGLSFRAYDHFHTGSKSIHAQRIITSMLDCVREPRTCMPRP